MKSLKKILAVLVAATMVAGMGVVGFGAGAKTSDGTLSIGGLEQGDVVYFYKVLGWSTSGSAVKTGGWVSAGTFGLSEDEISNILRYKHSGTTITTSGTGLTFEKVQELAGRIGDQQAMYSGTASATPSTVTVGSANSSVDPGLYIAIIKPATPGTVYNPVIVSSDWNPSGTSGSPSGSNVWNINKSGSYFGTEYSNGAVAKKSTIVLEKTITNQTNDNDPTTSGTGLANDAVPKTSYHTAGISDVIDFKIKTVVPTYSKEYVSPTFVLTDELPEFILTNGSVRVWKDESGTQQLDASGTYNITYSGTPAGSQSGNTSFKVEFTPGYLHRSTGAQTIWVTYSGTINPSGTFAYNVNEKENTVEVKYSNNPNESGSAFKLKDKTKNYVFSIDANVLGHSDQSGTEVVKVGLDENGNEIMGETKIGSGTRQVGALDGAQFTWKSIDGSGTVDRIVTSANNGKLTVTGIDAGLYEVKETSAPEGYVLDPNTYYVQIIPTFEKVEVPATGEYAAWSYDRLLSYVVKVGTQKNNLVTTAIYTVTEDSGTHQINQASGSWEIGNYGKISGTDPASGTSRIGKIQNTQGVALPSTGGIGTTLFYAGGAILVLLAGILLVSKRRAA